MDNVEVQRIVRMTIKELKRQGMIKANYVTVLKEVEPVLREYFRTKGNKQIEYFLRDRSDDTYIDILYLHYRDNITIERIAEVLEKDVSTIKRNKKRLIMSIYELLEESY